MAKLKFNCCGWIINWPGVSHTWKTPKHFRREEDGEEKQKEGEEGSEEKSGGGESWSCWNSRRQMWERARRGARGLGSVPRTISWGSHPQRGFSWIKKGKLPTICLNMGGCRRTGCSLRLSSKFLTTTTAGLSALRNTTRWVVGSTITHCYWSLVAIVIVKRRAMWETWVRPKASWAGFSPPLTPTVEEPLTPKK